MEGNGWSRRQFLQRGASSAAAATAATALTRMGIDPREVRAQERGQPKMKWRMQTYAGTNLGQPPRSPAGAALPADRLGVRGR
jgi:hypothetical protein